MPPVHLAFVCWVSTCRSRRPPAGRLAFTALIHLASRAPPRPSLFKFCAPATGLGALVPAINMPAPPPPFRLRFAAIPGLTRYLHVPPLLPRWRRPEFPRATCQVSPHPQKIDSSFGAPAREPPHVFGTFLRADTQIASIRHLKTVTGDLGRAR
ncbi:hypothetical protein B0H15DRAFT_431287 [Mycena belliarum]|uniref:Uncharacterized protein n=1 Tax=Mycena belliarum TaxID=1033014 RepID=A0AAD6TZ02_9AGAR|nr:hypothetical protein B0H15DRAFT_431287 [Mycena belliae]